MKKIISFLLIVTLLPLNITSVFAYNPENNTAFVIFDEVLQKSKVDDVSMGSKRIVNHAKKYGKSGWQLNSSSTTSSYININLNSSFANCNDDGTEYEVKVEYFALTDALFNIKYDSDSSSTKELDINYAKASTDWDTATFVIKDAYFGDRLDGYDLRIGVRSDMLTRASGNIIISNVTVTKFPQKNPVRVIEAKSEEYGNIFGNGEEKYFNVTYKNYSTEDKTFDVMYAAKNDYNDVIWQKKASFSLKSRETLSDKILVDAERYCLYHLEVNVTGNGFNDEKIVPFSFVNSDEDNKKNDSFGFNAHFSWNYYDPNEGMEVIKKSNAGYVRTSLQWQDVDPVKKPKFSYQINEATQKIIDAFKNTGIKWQLLLCYNNTKYGAENYKVIPKTDEQVKGYTGYASFLARTMAENNVDVHSFEIWNEPSIKSFNYSMEPASVYATLADKTAESIRKTNKTAEISVLSQTGIATTDGLEFSKNTINSASLENIDSISLHPYNHTSEPEQGVVDSIEQYKDMFIKKTGRTPKIHLTELGYYAYGSKAQTTLMQAQYNIRTYVYLHGKHLGDSFTFYDFSNDGVITNYNEHNFGSVESSNPNITDVPYAAKECFLADANLNKILRNAECTKNVIDDGTIFANVFNRSEDNKNVLCTWTAGNPEYKTFKLNCDFVTVYDLFGNSKKIYGNNGLFTLSLTNSMCYVEGDFTECQVTDTVYTPSVSSFSMVNGDKKTITINGFDENRNTLNVKGTDGIDVVTNGKEITVTSISNYERSDLLTIDLIENGKVIQTYSISIETKKLLSSQILTSSVKKSDISFWNCKAIVENHSINMPITGTITIIAPENFKNNIKPIRFSTIPAQSVGNIDFKMPRINKMGMYDFKYVVTTDSGYSQEFTQKLDFTIAVFTDKKPKIDGIMENGEWDKKSTLVSDSADQIYNSAGFLWDGKNDLSANTNIMVDKDNLYMFVRVKDDVFYAPEKGATIWKNDCVQFGIAFEKKEHDEFVGGTFTEIAASDSPDGPVVYRHAADNNDLPVGVVESASLAVKRDGDFTNYELCIPWNEITKRQLDFDSIDKIGFSMLVDDNDGNGRKGWIEYASGIGLTKNIDLFTFLCVAK